MRVLPVGLLLLTTSILPSLGCKRIAERMEERAIEKGTGGQVHVNGDQGTITIVNDGGANTISMGTGAKMPDDFPSAVPLYPGAKPSMAARTSDPNGKSVWTLALETPDSKDQVLAFYKAKMSGFTVESSVDMGQSTMSIYKSPQYEVSVITAAETTKPPKTVITMNAAATK